MKKVLKVLAIIAVLFGAGMATIFYVTGGMADAANEFFAAVKARDYPRALSHLSQEFRASTPQPEFIAFLERSALLGFKEASWSNRSVTIGRGELAGSVTSVTGGVIPLKLGFVKENGAWRIYSIKKDKAGLSDGDSTGSMPSEGEQAALVKASMSKLALSINSKDFSPLHAHISRMWQQQITADKLAETFKGFVDHGVDLSPLDKIEPVLQGPPSLDDNGMLLVKGYYPTKPDRVGFELKFIEEGVAWKLAGTNISMLRPQ